MGTGRFLSHLDPADGVSTRQSGVGGRAGLTSWCGWRPVRVGMLPLLQQLLRFLQQDLRSRQHPPISTRHHDKQRRKAYPLLVRVPDMPVGLEEGADVDGLAAPEVAVDGPVKRQFQRAFVQDSVGAVSFSPSAAVLAMATYKAGWRAMAVAAVFSGQWRLARRSAVMLSKVLFGRLTDGKG